MVKLIKECSAPAKKEYTRDEILNIIKTIDDIIKNSEYEFDDNYIISFDDMATVKESLRKLRRGI